MIRGDQGFTLAEVLVATAFIAITAGAIGVGFMQGTGSVETGRQQTTAVYLAANYGNYRRTVTVTANGANNKVIQVSVFYRPVNPVGGNAGNEKRVDASTMVTNRP
ncbi:MAG: hypothetical protein AUG80_03445 [Candidatus Rokubacteria bacterium 13_1_20CM_4_68_9]|nr:MAG: hypothetical protein AUG80_03445 [Candidatus Rokubacteria bacterium 13_1_20CM_4_68_9]